MLEVSETFRPAGCTIGICALPVENGLTSLALVVAKDSVI
jgi:hypothetical protein